MSLIALPLVMLLAMLLLGGLAAGVFALVYAIANKRPGVALAVVLAPVGAVVAVGILTALFVGTARFTAHSTAPPSVEWAYPPMPPMPAMPPMALVGPRTEIISGRPAWIVIVAILLFVVGIAAFVKRNCQTGERRAGWGKAILIGLLLFAAANFVILRFSYRTSSIAHNGHGRIQAQQELEEQIRRDAEHAQQHAIEIQRQIEAAQDKAAKHRTIEFKSMQELWEKLNQPRIQLEADEQGAKVESGAGRKIVTLEAPVAGEAKMIVPIGSETPESLARSLARLERMVERVSDLAGQVSDAGTLVGKAMVALSDTLDAPKPPKMSASLRAAQATANIEAQTTGSVVAPVAHVKQVDASTAASTKDSAPLIVELAIDQSKMNEYSVSRQEIFQALDKLGFVSHASSVDGELRKIRAIGGPDSESVSTIMDTVVAKVGIDERPVRLKDIATSIGSQTVQNEEVEGPRPAWVDLPSKRVGNVQKSVIVAGDFATREECNREADRLLMLAVAGHLAAITGTSLGEAPEVLLTQYGRAVAVDDDNRLRQLRRLNVGLDFVRREIAKDEYEETVQMSFGPMKRLYTLVEFTPSVDQELRQRWDEYRRQERFAVVGAGAGSVLGLIGLAFGLLKVDTWTKGYYTKRLFLGVPAAIIGLIGLLGLAAS